MEEQFKTQLQFFTFKYKRQVWHFPSSDNKENFLFSHYIEIFINRTTKTKCYVPLQQRDIYGINCNL